MWNATDLRDLNRIDRELEYRCPICFNVHTFDYDDDEEKYIYYDGDVYHGDCVNELISEKGVLYIKEEKALEFAEWYLDCRFNHFSYEDWLFNPMFEDKENVNQFISDEIEEFLRWANEKDIF